jgi:hypothetical protein
LKWRENIYFFYSIPLPAKTRSPKNPGAMPLIKPGFGQLGVKKFGGSSLRGNAREQRPIAVKRPIHLVMKSSLARGEQSSWLRSARNGSKTSFIAKGRFMACRFIASLIAEITFT